MVTPNRNTEFLALVDSEVKADILKSIGSHYGISSEQAYDEVTSLESEHLLDYMVEPARTPTSVLMQRYGMRGW